MPNYRIRVGSYDLPASFVPESDGGGEDIASADLPRMAGASTQEGRLRPRQLIISGQLTAATKNAWFTALDTLLEAVAGTHDIYYGRDDKLFKDAQFESWGRGDPANGRLWGIIGNISLTFTAARYPEPFGTTSHTPSLTASGATVNYSQGTAYTLPIWTITIDDAGTGPLTLTNSTTGETCIIAIPGADFDAGDVIELDRLTGMGKLNGVLVPGLFDRQIPRLKPGNNTITLTEGGTATVDTLEVEYPPRFLR